MFRNWSDCFEIFQSQFGNPPISSFEFLLGTACWSKKQDAGMLAGNAKRTVSSAIMSHALEQMKAAGIEVICQSSSSKLPTSCLHGYSASLRKIQGSTFFWEAIFATPRNCHEGWKMSLVFLVWHPPWFFSFSDTQKYQELCRVSKATHLMSIQPKMQEARERLKKTRSLRVVWGLLAMFRNWSDCFEIFQSQFGNPPISSFEFLLGTACWSKKQDAGMLAGNAKRTVSSAIMSHALEQMKAAGIEVICQSSSSKLPTSCLHGYSASLRKIRGSTFFREAIFATPRDCPGRNNSRFGLENEGSKMSLVFLVWHPPWFFSFSDMVWRLPIYIRECIKNSVKQAHQLTWAVHKKLLQSVDLAICFRKSFRLTFAATVLAWAGPLVQQTLSRPFRGERREAYPEGYCFT